VGIKVESKGGKSEFVLTSLVKTRMNKWNPLVHHPSGLVHWWVLVHSGWYRKASPCTELPHLLCQINGMAAGHYTLNLRVRLHSRGVMPCCQGFPLQQHIGFYGSSFIKWQIILCFILFDFIFTPGSSSSKSWYTMFWVRTSQYTGCNWIQSFQLKGRQIWKACQNNSLKSES
jgi:hypothetical protein